MIILEENSGSEKASGQGGALSGSAETFLDPPPLYLASGASSSNKPLPRIPPPPQLTSSNHLDIVRSEVPIKGTWTIDTSRLQSAQPNSEDSSQVRPNLRLLTQSGGIDAVVKVKGGNRAIIDATCFSGPVTLSITSSEDTAFCIRVASFQGDVLIRLPNSFYGPIKCRSRRNDNNLTLNNGHPPPIFSPSMQLQLVALSSIEETNSKFEECSFFLGDLTDARSMQQNQRTWTADEVFVEADCRDRVYFFWAGETADMPIEESTLLDTVLARFKPFQEVLRKPWTTRTSGRRESTE